MAFRVGQKVVCVDAESPGRGRPMEGQKKWASSEKIVTGSIYTVRRIYTDDYGVPALWLNEIRRARISVSFHGPNAGYGQWRFRPVVSTDTGMSILESIRRDASNGVQRKIREDA